MCPLRGHNAAVAAYAAYKATPLHDSCSTNRNAYPWPGPQPPQGGLPVHDGCSRVAPIPSAVCAPAAVGGSLRTSRPRLRRGPCPCAGPLGAARPPPLSRVGSGAWRPRCARPPRALRAPPRSRARPVCAAVRLRGRSLAPLCFGLALALRRPPCSVGLALLVRGSGASRVPRGGPPACPRWASSLAPASPPLGLRARRLPARPPARPCGPLPPPPGAGPFFSAPCACARLGRGFFLPSPLPFGECPVPVRGFAPALGRVFRAPVAGPPAGSARPRCAVFGAVHFLEIVNRLLTFGVKRDILEVRCPRRYFGGLHPWSPCPARKPLDQVSGGFFLCPSPAARLPLHLDSSSSEPA